MAKDIRDFFGDSDAGAPGTTWKNQPVGSTIEGVILPADVSLSETVGFTTVQSTSIGSNEPLYWLAREDQVPGQSKKTTRSTSSTGDELDPVTQGVILLQTAYRNFEFMTSRAIQNFKEDGKADDGLRRYFSSGLEGNAVRDALKIAKAPGRRPEVGAVLRATLASRTPNDFGGETNDVKVEYIRPTAESIKVAQAYIDANAPAAEPIEDDEPPF